MRHDIENLNTMSDTGVILKAYFFHFRMLKFFSCLLDMLKIAQYDDF
jgi:hypothetical protein